MVGLGALARQLVAAEPAAEPAAESADPGYRTEWPEDVPRFHPAEYAGTAVLLGGSLALRFGARWPESPSLDGGLPGEERIFEALYPESDADVHAWNVVADIPFYTSFAWSSLEPAVMAIAGGPDLGSQLFLMNLEGYAVTASVLWTTQFLARRRRPVDRHCEDDSVEPLSDAPCDDPESVRSLIGGHTAVVATTATLTCIHHIELELYGGGFRDAIPCGLWIAGTFMTFTGRTVTGAHYLSDNLLGVGLGVAAGLVPWSLHYARRQPAPSPTRADGLTPRILGIGVTPTEGVSDGGLLTVTGILP
jgi:hypothetical protein